MDNIIKVAFHTLGCKVNHYETEAMKEAFLARGAVAVGEEEYADAYIINTCTVTNIADRKSRQYIRRVRKINPDAVVAVTGCYAQVEPEEVAAMPEVDIVVGNGRKSDICGMVMEKLAEGSTAAAADVFVLPRSELTDYEDMRAYIKIQEGCDRFCAYCLIPYARGPVRSRPPQEIIDEAAMLVDSGVRELVLTGINTALYGSEKDFDCGITGTDGEILPGLEEFAAMSEEEFKSVSPLEIILARLDAMEGDFRVRLSSLEPTVVDKDHVEKIIRYRRLCHHLHLSVQNGSNRILKSMNRRYTCEDYLDIVRAIRDYDPLYGITTDIIVGFPGEEDEDFEDTVDVVRQASFGKVHVFRYSPRRGTPGASMDGAVPGTLKNGRADRLERISAETAAGFIDDNIGRICTVLTEEYRDGFVTGYTGNYIRTYIESDGETPRLGELCRVQLTQRYQDGCKAVAVLP